MESIKNIKAKNIQDYFETNTLSEKFFILNSDSQDMDEFRHAVVKDFPARLDIRMAILCEAGSVMLQLGYEEHTVCACDFINILPGKIFQIKEHAKEWIDEYTILEAKTMLKNSFLSVQQISYELNFATPSHFSRYFRHHTGLSPREYRNC